MAGQSAPTASAGCTSAWQSAAQPASCASTERRQRQRWEAQRRRPAGDSRKSAVNKAPVFSVSAGSAWHSVAQHASWARMYWAACQDTSTNQQTRTSPGTMVRRQGEDSTYWHSVRACCDKDLQRPRSAGGGRFAHEGLQLVSRDGRAASAASFADLCVCLGKISGLESRGHK